MLIEKKRLRAAAAGLHCRIIAAINALPFQTALHHYATSISLAIRISTQMGTGRRRDKGGAQVRDGRREPDSFPQNRKFFIAYSVLEIIEGHQLFPSRMQVALNDHGFVLVIFAFNQHRRLA
ncbi:unnamed protein product [Toxocara canis]|uniref:Transposase n=1 Tax=Toxocara canis TaxID=6265 RepID=A0A183UFA7_TOXCA|nr:unnamed protein product [Toxocara canis]